MQPSQPLEKFPALSAQTAEQMAPLATLIGRPRAQVQAAVEALGLPAYRAAQIWQWLYGHGVTEFQAMHSLSKPLQAQLAEAFTIARAGVVRSAVSLDDTRKWLLRFADGREVETVFIPDGRRGTLCVSSQVGCTLACTFCHTGTQPLVRNLTAGEIVTQVLVARDGLNEWPRHRAEARGPQRQQAHGATLRQSPARQLTNIVFMGMGEPLFNYEQLVTACEILLDGGGLAFSRRKVTVSTSGVVPRMYDLARDVGCNLAVSLHATRDDLRDEIVPINRKYPIAQLLEACRAYQAEVRDRHIMFEYVMLAGVNDSLDDARALVALLKGIRAKVNLIPFNPWPGAPYQCSSNNRIHAFGRVLIAAGIASPIRKTRGQDILAACGQLKSASERKKGERVKL